MKGKILLISTILILGISLGLGITQAASGFGDTSQVSGYQVPGTDGTGGYNSSLLDVIRTTVNRVLGMLSLVALILCIRGGLQMMVAGSDDSKVKSGTKVLKNAALGLLVIGLSWLIVSFIFRIIKKITG